MANRFEKAAKEATQLTNKQLANELAMVSKLSRTSIIELLPKKADKKAFVALMEQVEADTTMDEKLTFLQDNLESVGSVALRVLKAMV